MARTSWRDECRPIIAAVIATWSAAGEKAIRKALVAAYPWGEKKDHPYKIWCDEINVQLGKRKFRGPRKKVVKQVGQKEMFFDCKVPL